MNKNVVIKDKFWNYYIKLIKDTVIPYQWNILNDKIPDIEPSHAIDNFRIAAGELEGEFYGQVFQDSDLYKWLEAVGNILQTYPDPQLEKTADDLIELIERAQMPDGYLNTYFQLVEPDKRWTDVLECHELYCAGHFMEAAVAYYKTTDKRRILDIACRLADHIDSVFGPEEGKLHGYPGHQEIELALVKLYEVTKEERYLTLAKYFIDERGQKPGFFEDEFIKRDKISFWTKEKVDQPNRWYNQFPYSNYNQFHAPVREQKDATGHAVRAVYMYTGMADIALHTADSSLYKACRNLWDSIVNRQMYITGSIGSTHSGEAFTVDYDLPNDTNYSETCASIGLIFFAKRMLQLESNSCYADVMERALYNTVLGGMSADGTHFFYVNPLEVVPECCEGNTERNHVKPVRQKWFACACCPPNIARLISGLWQYIYLIKENTVFVNLFIESEAEFKLGETSLKIKQSSNYPWEGDIHFEIDTDCTEEAAIAVRIPGWCEKAELFVNGEKIGLETVLNQGYAVLNRKWKSGDQILLKCDMPVELMQAHTRVHYDAGRVAIQRGPLIYCLEEVDNGKYLNQITLPEDASLIASFEKNLLGGIVTVSSRAYKKKAEPQAKELYSRYIRNEEEVEIKAVPYFLWNNREPGEMLVWIRKNG